MYIQETEIVSEISASIVCYNSNADTLRKAIGSVLNVPLNIVLYIIDNSFEDSLQEKLSNFNIIYIHNPANPGFGAGHNQAIKLAMDSKSKYHFVINPDTYFDIDIISPMIKFMANNNDVGMMMPEILYPDGTLQYLPKLLPHPFWILRRKLRNFAWLNDDFIDKYELRNFASNKVYNSPLLSGCFTLLNLKAIEDVGAYDEKFFMYFEDFDLSRRMHKWYKTIYFPEVFVYHEYDSGASKSWRLFKIFITSAVIYFGKWGWFFDDERKLFNRKALEQF